MPAQGGSPPRLPRHRPLCYSPRNDSGDGGLLARLLLPQVRNFPAGSGL